MRRMSLWLALVALVLVAVVPSTVNAQKKKGAFGDTPLKKGAFSDNPKKKSAVGGAKKKAAGKKRGAEPAELPLLEKALVEHALSADEVDGLVNEDVNLLLNDGKRVEHAKLVKFIKAKDPSRFKSLSVEVEGTSEKSRTRSFTGKTLFRIEADKQSYELRFIPSQKAYALIDIEKHNAAIKSQLEAGGHKMWEPLSDEKQAKYVEEEKQFLFEVKEHFNSLPMALHESKYFLFMTDMPDSQVGPYLLQLDAMNEKLGEAFGFAPGENVWRGKAVVVAFVDEENFSSFETEFMKQPAPEHVQGLCHTFENGRVVVSINRGDSPSFFGAVLVHETSHGYMHRYKSNKVIPRWLNEGIADWIAGVTVPESSVVKERQREAVEKLQETGSLDGLFDGKVPESWQYGVGSTIVDLLVSHDREAFRLFFDGIKEGLTWEDSLQRAYGASPEDLITMYGNAIGIEELTR